jgi:hypothetical protein
MNYVIANIKVPIRINEDQSIKTFMDRTSITFETCSELPPENEFKHTQFLKNLKEFFQKSNVSSESSTPIESESSHPIESEFSNNIEPESYNIESESSIVEPDSICSLFVSKNDLIIKPSKPLHNTSFKKNHKIKKNHSHHFTVKNKSFVL